MKITEKLLNQILPTFIRNPSIPQAEKNHYRDLAGRIERSQKFALPEGTIDQSIPIRMLHPDNMRLPYESVLFSEEIGSPDGGKFTNLAFAWYEDYSKIESARNVLAPLPNDKVVLFTMLHISPTATATFPTTVFGCDPNNLVTTLISHRPSFLYPSKESVTEDDWLGAVVHLLNFLTMLSCDNVVVEKFRGNKAGGFKKAAKISDGYHVLKLVPQTETKSDSTGKNRQGRSPREHLRRGHFRRYADGRTVWVNSVTVNAGKGGKLHKEYAFC